MCRCLKIGSWQSCFFLFLSVLGQAVLHQCAHQVCVFQLFHKGVGGGLWQCWCVYDGQFWYRELWAFVNVLIQPQYLSFPRRIFIFISAPSLAVYTVEQAVDSRQTCSALWAQLKRLKLENELGQLKSTFKSESIKSTLNRFKGAFRRFSKLLHD